MPFEIGLADAQLKELASCCNNTIEHDELPSFLAIWPVVDDDRGLFYWGEHVKREKEGRQRPTITHCERDHVNSMDSIATQIDRLRSERDPHRPRWPRQLLSKSH